MKREESANIELNAKIRSNKRKSRRVSRILCSKFLGYKMTGDENKRLQVFGKY